MSVCVPSLSPSGGDSTTLGTFLRREGWSQLPRGESCGGPSFGEGGGVTRAPFLGKMGGVTFLRAPTT